MRHHEITARVAVCWDPVHRCMREEVAYDREGWGACTTPLGVLTSDGTSELVIRDPATLCPLQAIDVRAVGRPVFGLDDLECSPSGSPSPRSPSECDAAHDGCRRFRSGVSDVRCGRTPVLPSREEIR